MSRVGPKTFWFVVLRRVITIRNLRLYLMWNYDCVIRLLFPINTEFYDICCQIKFVVRKHTFLINIHCVINKYSTWSTKTIRSPISDTHWQHHVRNAAIVQTYFPVPDGRLVSTSRAQGKSKRSSKWSQYDSQRFRWSDVSCWRLDFRCWWYLD